MIVAFTWVAISLIGFVFAAVDVAGAYAHYNLVSEGWPDHERLLRFTRNQFISQSARMVLLLVFLVIGVNALAAGPRGVFVYGMFTGNIVVVATAIQSHRYRKRVFQDERLEYETKAEEARELEQRARELRLRAEVLRAEEEEEQAEKQEQSNE